MLKGFACWGGNDKSERDDNQKPAGLKEEQDKINVSNSTFQ